MFVYYFCISLDFPMGAIHTHARSSHPSLYHFSFYQKAIKNETQSSRSMKTTKTRHLFRGQEPIPFLYKSTPITLHIILMI